MFAITETELKLKNCNENLNLNFKNFCNLNHTDVSVHLLPVNNAGLSSQSELRLQYWSSLSESLLHISTLLNLPTVT